MGGGGGTLTFSSYVGLGPASTGCRQKKSVLSSTPKKYLKFLPRKNIFIMYIYLKEKTLKYIEETPKTSPILS